MNDFENVFPNAGQFDAMNEHLGNIADSMGQAPAAAQITLTAAGWTGTGPFTQVVSLPGITSNSMVNIMPNADALEQMITDRVKSIFIENDEGTLTAIAVGNKPTAAITVGVYIAEVPERVI